jgi:hypothetical protein
LSVHGQLQRVAQKGVGRLGDAGIQSDNPAPSRDSCQADDFLDQRVTVYLVGSEKIHDPASRMSQRMPGCRDEDYAQSSA